MAVSSSAAAADMEVDDNVSFVFDLLDDINKRFENEPDLDRSDLQDVVNDHIRMKDIQFSDHRQRVIHFILYLNTEADNCAWVNDDSTLNLNQYIHGKPVSKNVYYKLVEILNLNSYIGEMIMFTPYSFNCDLVDIVVNKIKTLDGIPQLSATENLIIALVKSIERLPVQCALEEHLNTQFNHAMMVFREDHIPYDMRRLDYETEQKVLAKYNGFRVKAIFKIFVEIIKFKKNPNIDEQYALYNIKSLRSFKSPTDIGSIAFKKFFDVIMHKCMNMCNFSIDNWLSWYEIEVIEDDTNLQAIIGHLCFDLCTFIDNGSVDENCLREFRPVLSNIAIKKTDFTIIDINDIDGMIDRMEHNPKFDLNDWIKKMIENPNIFSNSRAIQTLDNYMENVDYDCFKSFIDHCIINHKRGGVFQSLGRLIYKGLKHMNLEDKTNILKHIIINYPDNEFQFTSEFDNELHYIAHNETTENIDQKELLTKLIWLVMQQPKKMLHILISQYVHGIYGLPVKTLFSKKLCLHQVLIFMHLYMEPKYIYSEYNSWLDIKSKLPADQNKNLYNWIVTATKNLHLLKPKTFLARVIAPLLIPSLDYDHMSFLISFTKFFLTECHLMSPNDIELWDTLLIQLGKVMDDARWTIKTFSTVRVEICENIILCLQPLLHFAVLTATPTDLENIKKELSGLHLLTRSHLLRLWTSEYITIEGMDEQFIMTIQSQSHISYSNLNRSSNQGVIEEFIFSIAAYLPKLTMHEMKSFVANYLSSAKTENITEASFFLLDSVMNGLLRIIVYLKTAVQNDPFSNECARNYLANTVINFLDTVNTSRMCSIYNEDIIDIQTAFNSVAKIVMVIRQLKDTQQLPLLIFVHRLIDVIINHLNAESNTKLLLLLTTMKSETAKNMFRNTIEMLVNKLEAPPSHT